MKHKEAPEAKIDTFRRIQTKSFNNGSKEKDSPSLKRFIELKLEAIANNYKPIKH